MGANQWDGRERRKIEPIHPYQRWLLVLWIVIFTLAVGYALRQNRDTTKQTKGLVHDEIARIHELAQTKAAINSLEKTNCGLEQFLLTARRARYQAYERSHHKSDLEAVEGYERLIKPFQHATGYCPVPKRLIIKQRPLDLGRGN